MRVCTRWFGLVVVWAAGLVSACGVHAKEAEQKLNVVCTTGMVGDVVREVGGDGVEVAVLMGAGVDPHLYKPTRDDVAKIMRADVVFYSGLLLEGKMTDTFVRAATAGRKVYAVTELIEEQWLLEPEQMQGHYDPHVWMDPKAWSKAVLVVRDRLSELVPEKKEQFEANAAAYLATLDELDAYAQRVLLRVSEEQRVLVTAHDAFGYFGRRYGYEVLGIQGLSTESEAGVRDIERLVDVLVERRVGAVFVESTVADRNVKALIAGAMAKGHTVAVGGELFSDAMGTPGTYEGTYVGMIDHNVTTIARALGADVPASGMQGMLRMADTGEAERGEGVD